MSKYQFKMTDLLQFQFKLLFCFEKKEKILNAEEKQKWALCQLETKIQVGENENQLEKL